MCGAEKGVQTELGQVRGPTFHLLTPLMCLRVSRAHRAAVCPGMQGCGQGARGRQLPCPMSLEFREVCG